MRTTAFTPQFMIQELLVLTEILGRVPKQREFVEYSESKYAFRYLFNNRYNNLVEAAGLKARPGKTLLKDSNTELVKELQKLAVENTAAKSVQSILRAGKYAIQTYYNKLGDYEKIVAIINDARIQAGLPAVYKKGSKSEATVKTLHTIPVKKNTYTKYPIIHTGKSVLLKWARHGA